LEQVIFEPKNIKVDHSCVNLNNKIAIIYPDPEDKLNPKKYSLNDYKEYLDYIQQGYDMSNLVKEKDFDQDLSCPICLQVLNDP
jgi:hypothetical protein